MRVRVLGFTAANRCRAAPAALRVGSDLASQIFIIQWAVMEREKERHVATTQDPVFGGSQGESPGSCFREILRGVDIVSLSPVKSPAVHRGRGDREPSSCLLDGLLTARTCGLS